MEVLLNRESPIEYQWCSFPPEPHYYQLCKTKNVLKETWESFKLEWFIPPGPWMCSSDVTAICSPECETVKVKVTFNVLHMRELSRFSKNCCMNLQTWPLKRTLEKNQSMQSWKRNQTIDKKSYRKHLDYKLLGSDLVKSFFQMQLMGG